MKSVILTIGLFLCGFTIYAQSVISYVYDKQGRLESEHCESVYRLQFTYDVEGNLISKALTNYTDISRIDDTAIKDIVRLFPNPAEDFVMIESFADNNLKKVYLYDISGRELKQVSGQTTSIRLDITNFKRGVYFLKAESDKDTFVLKLIKK